MATKNIVPRADGEGNIGTQLKNWFKGWFKNLFVSGNITDGTNSTTVASIKDAVDRKHTHANKTELDLITDGDHDVRTDNPHNVTASQVGTYAQSEIDNLLDNKVDKSGSLTDIATRNHSDLQNKNAETDVKHVTDAQKDALDNANSPSASNYFLVKSDIYEDYNKSEGISSTTATTWQTKLSISLPSSGTWIVEYYCEITNNTLNNAVEIRLRDLTNSTNLCNHYLYVAGSADEWRNSYGFEVITVSDGTSISLQYRAQIGGTASIRRARIQYRKIL